MLETTLNQLLKEVPVLISLMLFLIFSIKNLPSEDPSSGIKIMSIKADEESNIVYLAQVPESFENC
jgi:hypothetical protein